MPYMKPYTAKHFEGMADNGKMSDVPDGMLFVRLWSLILLVLLM